MPLTKDQAQRFFGSLYDDSASDSATPDLNGFESAAIRLVARFGTSTAPGDRALGLLMLNHVMSTPTVDPDKKNALTAAVLMNIKAPAVDGFLQEFPQTTLDNLVKAAQNAGYQVDVLSPTVANTVPRSVVGR
jgi:hypothetical protein